MCDELVFVTSFTTELREKLGEVVHSLNSYFVLSYFLLLHIHLDAYLHPVLDFMYKDRTQGSNTCRAT